MPRSRSLRTQEDQQPRSSTVIMRLIHLTIPLALIPLFVCLPSMSFPLMYFLGFSIVRDSINLCGSVLLCVIGIYAYFFIPIDRKLLRYIHRLLLWITLSLIAGLYVSPTSSNFLFYIQTILPLFALLYGYAVMRTQQEIPQIIRVAITSTNVVVVALYVIILGKYGLRMFIGDRMQAMYELAYGIPQFKSYYPICIQFTFSLALAQYLFGRRLSHTTTLISLAIHASFVIFCWSRAGMLGFALTTIVQFCFALMIGSRFSRERTALVFVLLLVVVTGLSEKLGTTIAFRESVHDRNNASDEKRLNLFWEGLNRCVERPLFGDSFIPAWDEREGGLVEGQERLFGSHNQYIDLSLRGGVVYLILFLSLMWKGIRNGIDLMRVCRHPESEPYLVLGVAGSSFLTAVAIESNFQLYFIQLLTAVPCMMLIGMLFRARRLAIGQRYVVVAKQRKSGAHQLRAHNTIGEQKINQF